MTDYVDPPRDIACAGQAELLVHSNFYLLEAGGEHDGGDSLSQDGLAFGGPSWLGIGTGTDYAPLPCRAEVLRRMPPKVDRGYEMAAEYDLEILFNFVRLTGPLGQFPHLTLAADPGRHRVRVHVRGRDHGLRASAIGAAAISRINPERHLIQIWPSINPRMPELVYGPDEFARNYG